MLRPFFVLASLALATPAFADDRDPHAPRGPFVLATAADNVRVHAEEFVRAVALEVGPRAAQLIHNGGMLAKEASDLQRVRGDVQREYAEVVQQFQRLEDLWLDTTALETSDGLNASFRELLDAVNELRIGFEVERG